MPFKGYRQTEEHREKLRVCRIGKRNGMYNVHRHNEDNPNWKGDKVGYHGLHIWLKKRIPKPEYCQFCKIKPAEELANISGIYDRNFNNYTYLCCKCHKVHDMEIIKQYKK